MRALVTSGGFLKRCLAAKSPAVRRASYAFVRHLTDLRPAILAGCLQEAAPLALGALGEKEASGHAAMWSMVLALCKVG